MTQFRNNIPIPSAQYEEMRNGESESLTLDPYDLRTHPKITSTRDVDAYERFLARADFAERKNDER